MTLDACSTLISNIKLHVYIALASLGANVSNKWVELESGVWSEDSVELHDRVLILGVPADCHGEDRRDVVAMVTFLALLT